MNNKISVPKIELRPPSPSTLDALNLLQERKLQEPQIPIFTEHLIHGGMYARTIRLDPGIDLIGSIVNQSTILIVNGKVSMLAGDERTELDGYNVLSGLAGRKQLFTTHSAVEMTMICATVSMTVEEAENEIFAEADKLMSRTYESFDTVEITGL